MVDVSKVTYDEDSRTIAEVMAVTPPGPQLNHEDMFPVYEGIGSLDDFLELQHLEVSVCVLGPFQTVDDLIKRLPGSLETLVLLSPTQYGQPDIEELVEGLLCWGPEKTSKLKTVNHQPVVRSTASFEDATSS